MLTVATTHGWSGKQRLNAMCFPSGETWGFVSAGPSPSTVVAGSFVTSFRPVPSALIIHRE